LSTLEINKKIICVYYEYFYSKLIGQGYSFKLNKLNSSILNNFLNYLTQKNIKLESLGDVFWYNYFCFQFEYWSKKYTRLGEKNVEFSWIIGYKAYERWEKKPDNWFYFCEIGFIKNFNILKFDLIEEKQKKNDFSNYYRKLMKNGERLNNCFLFTSLFDSKSLICKECLEKDICKDLLQIKICNKK
jgi:hypothetical protein